MNFIFHIVFVFCSIRIYYSASVTRYNVECKQTTTSTFFVHSTRTNTIQKKYSFLKYAEYTTNKKCVLMDERNNELKQIFIQFVGYIFLYHSLVSCFVYILLLLFSYPISILRLSMLLLFCYEYKKHKKCICHLDTYLLYINNDHNTLIVLLYFLFFFFCKCVHCFSLANEEPYRSTFFLYLLSPDPIQ